MQNYKLTLSLGGFMLKIYGSRKYFHTLDNASQGVGRNGGEHHGKKVGGYMLASSGFSHDKESETRVQERLRPVMTYSIKHRLGGDRIHEHTHIHTHISIDLGERMGCGVVGPHGGCPHYCSGRAIFSNLGSG